MLLALVLAACGKPKHLPEDGSQPVTLPAELEPERDPWTDQRPGPGPGHLDGGVRVSAKVAVLQQLLPDSLWLEALEPGSTLTATLMRPIGAALHHRVHGLLRSGASWPNTDQLQPSCPSVGSLACVQLEWGKAYVHADDRARTIDFITQGEPSSQAVLEASDTIPNAEPAPPLFGDIVILAPTLDQDPGLEQEHVPAFDRASLEVIQDAERVRARLRWTPRTAWHSAPSDSAAPSWDALCSGAVACARTGPWPDVHRWLQSLGPVRRPEGAARLAVSTWSGTWPQELAASIATLRARSPEVSRGFIDAALDGLAEVEFAGARLDEGGVFIAFVRVPTSWVNFTASVLPYVGLAPAPTKAGRTEVTWAPFPGGGIVLSLDDGPQPTMGWVALASSPERFAWLLDAPTTGAHVSTVTARIGRIGDVVEHLPTAWAPWLRPYANHTATLWAGVEAGQLSVSIDLQSP